MSKPKTESAAKTFTLAEIVAKVREVPAANGWEQGILEAVLRKLEEL